jgi:hypothetical protein
MHNIHLIRRRFPNSSRTIITIALIISLSALAAGVGLLILNSV